MLPAIVTPILPSRECSASTNRQQFTYSTRSGRPKPECPGEDFLEDHEALPISLEQDE